MHVIACTDETQPKGNTMDKTLSFKVVVTNAPAEFDYGRTFPGAPLNINTVLDMLDDDAQYVVQVVQARGDTMRVVLVPADDCYQVPRYRSGLYVAITVQA